jgi:hypothetical protein
MRLAGADGVIGTILKLLASRKAIDVAMYHRGCPRSGAVMHALCGIGGAGAKLGDAQVVYDTILRCALHPPPPRDGGRRKGCTSLAQAISFSRCGFLHPRFAARHGQERRAGSRHAEFLFKTGR